MSRAPFDMSLVCLVGLADPGIRNRGLEGLYQAQPRKPLELPPAVARAFVRDMAAQQLHALRAYQRQGEKKLRITDVKEMFLQMKEHM